MLTRKGFEALYSFCSDNRKAKTDTAKLTVIRNEIDNKTIKQITDFYGPTWYKTLGVKSNDNKRTITDAVIARCIVFVKK